MSSLRLSCQNRHYQAELPIVRNVRRIPLGADEGGCFRAVELEKNLFSIHIRQDVENARKLEPYRDILALMLADNLLLGGYSESQILTGNLDTVSNNTKPDVG